MHAVAAVRHSNHVPGGRAQQARIIVHPEAPARETRYRRVEDTLLPGRIRTQHDLTGHRTVLDLGEPLAALDHIIVDEQLRHMFHAQLGLRAGCSGQDRQCDAPGENAHPLFPFHSQSPLFGAILGTGGGGGVVVDGRLLEGRSGVAGEWGHSPLPGTLAAASIFVPPKSMPMRMRLLSEGGGWPAASRGVRSGRARRTGSSGR